LAAVCWSVAKSALALVSDPVTAVPIQPRSGDRKAKAAPAPAIHLPMVIGLAGEVHDVGQGEHRGHREEGEASSCTADGRR
jgi:hypothetical protein